MEFGSAASYRGADILVQNHFAQEILVQTHIARPLMSSGNGQLQSLTLDFTESAFNNRFLDKKAPGGRPKWYE